MIGIWCSWKIFFYECEIFRKLPFYYFDCIVVIIHLLKSQYYYRRSMLRLTGCKISFLEIYLFSKLGNWNFFWIINAFFSLFQYATSDIYLLMWADKGITKRHTENSKKLFVLFFWERVERNENIQRFVIRNTNLERKRLI